MNRFTHHTNHAHTQFAPHLRVLVVGALRGDREIDRHRVVAEHVGGGHRMEAKLRDFSDQHEAGASLKAQGGQDLLKVGSKDDGSCREHKRGARYLYVSISV